MTKYKVVLLSQDKDKSLVTVETDAHGSFCFKAKPGAYKVQVRCALPYLKYWRKAVIVRGPGAKMFLEGAFQFPPLSFKLSHSCVLKWS
jgi:hypothetical protein